MNAPLLDPARGGARRAADRLLRRVVVPVAPRSGGRRRVLHRRPFFPVRRWLARSPLGFRLSLSPAAVAGGSEQPLGRFRLGRSEPELTFARGFNGGRRKPLALPSSLRPMCCCTNLKAQSNRKSSSSHDDTPLRHGDDDE